jgi:dTDP-glucose 4,6-dehydratase
MGRVVVTGGAGFIGSHVCESLLFRGDSVLCFDKLTYATSAAALNRLNPAGEFEFLQGDITDYDQVQRALNGADVVINCAAETHVDRSILAPGKFAYTDTFGVAVLLEQALKAGVSIFVQVSTDEVYGEVVSGAANEQAPLRSRSPYAASKAGADLFAQAISHTYGLDVRITRGCNTYGPWQHPEKFIPLMIANAIDGLPLPVYGDGLQVREWVGVEDHANAIIKVLDEGEPKGIYNIGTGERLPNIEVARRILRLCGRADDLIQLVADRPGHDRRYAVETSRVHELGWAPKTGFDEGLARTADWYQHNDRWWRELKAGSREYFDRMYTHRDESLAFVSTNAPLRPG